MESRTGQPHDRTALGPSLTAILQKYGRNILRSSRPYRRVKGDNAKGPAAYRYGLVAHARHQGGKFCWAEKARDGVGEVSVSGAVAGEPAANAREDTAKIRAVKIADKIVGRLGEFEDSDGAARLENAMHFLEAGIVVGKITEAEGGGDQIEGLIREGKAEGVGFGDGERWRTGQAMARAEAALETEAREHGVSEVSTDDSGFTTVAHREREVAGATTEIEDESVGAHEDRTKESGGAGTPEAIELKGKDVVERVVSRRDLREHLPHLLGGVGFRACAVRAGAGGGYLSHGACPSG